ncbi:hypothetical protein [Empedobacter sp. GD03865]|uniref:hypothetical protein n=1 Tax=Empedobacter sp. GD03865 TaxID=2975392 RepID=UPI00244D1F21|nr:hypothetical protein [Empedobacter sp. GD03865]MDH0660452.1 hypothetical protein [Empedobacter sp. GD03865]
MLQIYTTIPVELCIYGLVNRKINHLKLLVYLKSISSGHILFERKLFKTWAIDLATTHKTVESCYKWLIMKKIITINSKTHSHRIISYSQIHKILNFNSQSAVIFELDDFEFFKEFCISAIVGYLISKKRYLDRKEQSESKMEDSNLNCSSYSKNMYPLPISYFAKSINVSKSTANNYLRIAEKKGFLKIKKRTSFLIDDNGNKISSSNMNLIKGVNPKLFGRLRVKDGFIKVVDSSLIISNVYGKRKRFKYRKKSKRYKWED